MTSRKLDVLVVGSLHLDIVVEAQALPRLDETARGSAWRMVAGGKGGNQACWAVRLGARTAMLGQVGDDDFGRRLVANLQQCGVDAGGVVVDPKQGSGMSVAILNSEGDYGAVIVSGSNLSIDATQIRRAFDHLQPHVVVLQNEIEEAINSEAARLGHEAGARIVLNAAPARALPEELAALVDVLVVNRVEAEMMSGKTVNNAETAMAALPALQRFGRNVIVTLGSGGVVVAEQAQAPHWLQPVAVEVVSTHGAGDCFVGQLAVALAKGQSLFEAARAANATAARYVSGELTD